MKTLAVLIAGEFRTWPKCSEYLFRFFEGRAERIDYYFSTWSESNDLPGKEITKADVEEKFTQHQKNLVTSAVIRSIGRKASTFYNQAFLAKFANILKREHELKHNFVYDQVVETRPDIYIRRNVGQWRLMNDYEFCNCNFITKSQQGFDQIDDVYYRSTSFTNDILANRYWFRKPIDHYVMQHWLTDSMIESWHNHHCMVMEYCNLNNIRFATDSADILGSHIAVRQDAVHVNFDDGDTEDLKARYQPSTHSWQKLDRSPINWH